MVRRYGGGSGGGRVAKMVEDGMAWSVNRREKRGVYYSYNS